MNATHPLLCSWKIEQFQYRHTSRNLFILIQCIKLTLAARHLLTQLMLRHHDDHPIFILLIHHFTHIHHAKTTWWKCDLLRKACFVIWLWTEIERVQKRLSSRPSLLCYVFQTIEALIRISRTLCCWAISTAYRSLIVEELLRPVELIWPDPMMTYVTSLSTSWFHRLHWQGSLGVLLVSLAIWSHLMMWLILL